MRLKRIFAITKKEFIHIRRDRRSLILSFLIPIFLLILFGYALSLDIREIPVTVMDYDNSEYSRELIGDLTQSGYFVINDYTYDYETLEKNIASRNSAVGIVIPPNFSKNINSGKNAQLQTILDGSSSNKASIASGYIKNIVIVFSSKILKENQSMESIKTPLNTDIRIWYNPELESRNFIIPGIIAVIILMISSLLASQVISREWENGTMEQLIVSPVKPFEIILGKIIPYFIIGMLDLAIVVISGRLLFDIPFKGSILLLFSLAVIFLIGSLGMGISISIITKSQVLSYQIAMISSFLPSYIISGLIFPISSMPRALQFVSYLVPARYFISILRGIFLKGSGFFILSLEALYITIFAVVMLLVANFSFIKKLN